MRKSSPTTADSPRSPSRRSLLPAARRVLWPLLRARARGPRRALRERLRAFLRTAGRSRLWRLVREAAFAAGVAAALLGTTSSAEAIELADVAAGHGGFAVHGEGTLGSGIGWNVADAGDVNGDGIPDAIVGGRSCFYYYCYAVPSYVVFGRADGAPIELSEIAKGKGGFVIREAARGDYSYSGYSVSGAGDLNGDGLSDLLIGAPNADPEGRGDAGASYVVFGKATGEPVELSEIAAGQGGFVIRGENASDRSGSSVSEAGDLNGDGLSDLLIGAPFTSPGERGRTGATYVVFGKATTEAVELSQVAAGVGGFVIRGEKENDRSGSSVSGTEDVNGDAIPDLLIGAPNAGSAVTSYTGASYVVFGKASGDPVELAQVAAGTGGFVIRGENANDYSGGSVSGADDVNGDAIPDLLIGAPGHPWSDNPGASYVVFGKATTEAVELSGIAAGTGGFVIRGESAYDRAGSSVSGAGDLNGDGFADLLIGAPGRPWSDDPGASYVVFGKAAGDAIDLSQVASGAGGFVIRGENAGDQSGRSVSGAGDVDGDGIPDLLIGAPEDSYYGDPGASYIVFGKATGDAVELSQVAAGQGGRAIRGLEGRDFSPLEISDAGDVNGDGIPDLLVGSPGSYYSGERGTSYVVFGKATTDPIELSQVAAGQGGFAIRGEREFDYSGSSVSGAGDVNGDGLADLLVGAPRADPEGRGSAGASYVVFGKATGEKVELSEIAAGQGGFVIRGENVSDRSGSSVSRAGDLNGDGLEDLLVGAPSASAGERGSTGASYVVFGKATTEAVELSEIAAGQGGFVIRGENANDRSGSSVSRAEDLNGDGVPELLIGAPHAAPGGGVGIGASYVVFGKATTEAVELSQVAAGQGGFTIRGESELDYSGGSVSGAGDLNGDGVPDLLIGAPGRRWSDNPGASYVVFGKATTEAVELSQVAAGTGGFVIRGESAYDHAGSSVSGAGDLNGDGFADLLIGAPGRPWSGDPGASYVVFGKTTGDAVELSSVAAARGGFALRGESVSDASGLSVSGAGDLNGDGIPDVAIGSYGGFSYGDVDGTAYVVFGSRSEGVPRFRRGEVNGDMRVNVSDAVAALNYLFRGGNAPACFDGADANDDGKVDLADAVATLSFLFAGGGAPSDPGPAACGVDPTDDDPLGCERPPEDCG